MRPELDLNALRRRSVALEVACEAVLSGVERLEAAALHADDSAVERLIKGLDPVFGELSGPLAGVAVAMEALWAEQLLALTGWKGEQP